MGNSVGGWITAEMAPSASPRISSVVLLDAVGIEAKGHPVADVSGLSVTEIQALSFHDPSAFRVDPATIPDAQKAIVAANGAALAVYAGSPAMADPTLLGRLNGIALPTLVLWGESDQIVNPPMARHMPLQFLELASRCSQPPDTCPRWGVPISSYRGSGARRTIRNQFV